MADGKVIDFNAARKRLRGLRDTARCPECDHLKRFCACEKEK